MQLVGLRSRGRIVAVDEVVSSRFVDTVAEATIDDTGDADLARARGGDNDAFARLVAPLRGELRAHCYRMLGSVDDADDVLQDSLLRAWRGLPRFAGRSSLRTWLYSVATRACLDQVKVRRKRALPMDLGAASRHVVFDGNGPLTDVAWLGPYPDADLADGAMDPEAHFEQREAVELAFTAALQHLSGNQRAALLLFEVLGFPAAEIATIMNTSTTSVNSALARARKIVEQKVPAVSQQQTLRTMGDARLRELVTRFASAFERRDSDALVALLTEDVTWSMPPLPHWYHGLAAVTDFAMKVPMTRCPSWRCQLTSANGQPAVAFYIGDVRSGQHVAWSITVLTLRGDRIAEITSFLGRDHFSGFRLPDLLP